MTAVRPLSASALLTAWECARVRHPIDRALLLFALAVPEAKADSLADMPLGRRNLALLELRQATFGNRLRGYLDCPSCGERLELKLDLEDLMGRGSAARDAEKTVSVDGLRFRLPTSRDLAYIAQEEDMEAGASRLLDLCLLEDRSVAPSAESALASCMDQVEAAMDLADPLADMALAFECDFCGHRGTAPLDIGAFLWEEIDARAQGLLDEVHLLARTYGWREAEVLALSEARRAAYLERVTA